VTQPSLPRDRIVEAIFSESAETAAAVSQFEIEPWRWLHDPCMVYGEYGADSINLSNKARVRAHASEPYNKTGWMYVRYSWTLVRTEMLERQIPRFKRLKQLLARPIPRSTSGSELPEL